MLDDQSLLNELQKDLDESLKNNPYLLAGPFELDFSGELWGAFNLDDGYRGKKTKDAEQKASEFKLIGGDGEGSQFCIWQKAPVGNPVLFLGGEGEEKILAESLRDFLAMLGNESPVAPWFLEFLKKHHISLNPRPINQMENWREFLFRMRNGFQSETSGENWTLTNESGFRFEVEAKNSGEFLFLYPFAPAQFDPEVLRVLRENGVEPAAAESIAEVVVSAKGITIHDAPGAGGARVFKLPPGRYKVSMNKFEEGSRPGTHLHFTSL